MARRRSQPISPASVVLDSEAVSALAHPEERSTSRRRAQAVLHAIELRGGLALVPAPVLAEVSRGRRRAAVNRVLGSLEVVPTDRGVAELAGTLLATHRLGSEHAVDAFVTATAGLVGAAVVLTGDRDRFRRLTAGLERVVSSRCREGDRRDRVARVPNPR